MFCPKCAAEADNQAKFCAQCGAPLGQQPPPSPAEKGTVREQFMAAARSRQGGGIEGEDSVWEGNFSRWTMFGWWVTAGVAAVGVIVGGLLTANPLVWGVGGAVVGVGTVGLLAYYAFRRFSVHYELTTQRFLHERGLLWRRTDRIELIDIDDVTFTQGPLERLFGVGTIHIASSDKTDPEIDLPGIDDVARVAGQIDDLRRKERRQRGLHIEAV